MSTKFRTGLLCLFVAIAAAFSFKFFLWDGLEERQEAIIAHEAIRATEAQKEIDRIAAFKKKMARMVTVSEWETLAKELASSPILKKQRGLFSPIIAAKTFEARAFKRDNLLVFAGKLVASDENDPTAEEYYERAKALHEENMRVIDTILERPNDCAWNRRLWYRKGIEYYRSLIFLNSDERSLAADLIDQAIDSFDNVFLCFPKDRDAELAIELLYKRSKKMKESPAASEKKGKEKLKEKLPLFPSEEVSPDVGKNQQRREGRH